MSTPSETMFTATIHGSRALRERGQLLGGPGLGVEHHQRPLPGRLAQQRGDPARVVRVCGDHQPAGVAMSVLAQRPELGVASRRIRGSPSGSSVEIAVR